MLPLKAQAWEGSSFCDTDLKLFGMFTSDLDGDTESPSPSKFANVTIWGRVAYAGNGSTSVQKHLDVQTHTWRCHSRRQKKFKPPVGPSGLAGRSTGFGHWAAQPEACHSWGLTVWVTTLLKRTQGLADPAGWGSQAHSLWTRSDAHWVALEGARLLIKGRFCSPLLSAGEVSPRTELGYGGIWKYSPGEDYQDVRDHQGDACGADVQSHEKGAKVWSPNNCPKGTYKDDRTKLFLEVEDDTERGNGCKLHVEKVRADIRKISLLGEEFSLGAGYPGRLEVLLGGFQHWKESEIMGG